MNRLLAPMEASERHEVGGVTADVAQAGNGRIKRVTYPPGFRWSTHMQPVTGGEACQHTHVGFLAAGQLAGRYTDGCSFEYRAPAVVVIEAGHDGWVVGNEAAVLVEFDHQGDTAQRFGLPAQHGH